MGLDEVRLPQPSLPCPRIRRVLQRLNALSPSQCTPPPRPCLRTTGTVASKVVPFLYGPKVALLSLGSQTPYSTIYDSVKRDAAIAIGIAGSLLAFGGLKLTGVL